MFRNIRRGARRAITLGALLTLSASTVLACGSPGDAGETPASVTIGYGGGGVLAYTATYIAQEQGYFAEELEKIGSSAEFVDLEGTTAALQALSTGDVHFATATTSVAINAVAQGADITEVSQFLDGDMTMLTATPGQSTDINDPVSLVEGKKWGIAAFGAGAHLPALTLLRGWDYPDDAIEFVTIGQVASSQVAVRQGMADYYWLGTAGEALVASGEVDLVLDLYDPAEAEKLYGGPFASAGLFSTNRWTQEQPEVTAAVFRAQQRALEFIDEHRDDPEAIKNALPAEVVTDGTVPFLQRILPGHNPTGAVNPQAMTTVLEAMVNAGFVEDASKVDLDAFVAEIQSS